MRSNNGPLLSLRAWDRAATGGEDTTQTGTGAPFYQHPDGYEMWKSDHRIVLVHGLAAVAEYGFETVADGIVHHRTTIPWDALRTRNDG